MSESNQPFTDHVTRSRRDSGSSFTAWVTAIVMAALMLVFLALWLNGKSGQKSEAESLKARINEATNSLAAALAENQTNAETIASLKEQVAALEKEKEMTVQKSKSLEDELRSELESKDVAISKLQGRLTVTILDRVMFDSGEAVLKPDGAAVMKKIAAILAEHPELKIHVIGHTDNVPIRASAQGRFASNWELSAARALAAVHYLTEQAGIAPQRMGAVGYGEYRPIADNSTAEGRARNRRIAITILADELAGADTVPKANSLSPTNSP